jgi:predicted phage terminase large subunit-like protein
MAGHSHLLSPLTMAESLTAGTTGALTHPKHLQVLSDELVQLWRKDPGWPRRLMVFMPPRHGKSETCSHWYPAWNLALDPATKIILCSYADELAAQFGRFTRRTVEKHLPVLGVRIQEDSRAVHRWETKDGGGMITAGVGGPISGKGGDLLIIDDPVKNADEAASPTIKEKIWNWYTTTFLTRGESPDTLMLLIMTRWAVDDLAGRILDGEEGHLWRVVSLPGEAKEDDPLGRSEGEPLWDKFGSDFYASRRREMGAVQFGALYQQEPVPDSGLAIPEAWWRYYDKLPDEFDQIVLSWDTTVKDLASSDYCCGGAWGRSGADYYLLDLTHERLNFPDTCDAIRQMKQRFPTCRQVLIEEAASGPQVIQVLAHEIPGIVPIPPVGAKSVRLHWAVNSVAGLIEAGRVYLPEGHRLVKELTKEFKDFPNGKHDDYVDMTTQGLNFLQPRGWTYEGKKAREVKPPENAQEAMSRDYWGKIHKRLKDAEKGQPEKFDSLPGF